VQRKAAAEGLVCEEEFLKSFDFRMAGAWARFEGDNIAPVTFAALLDYL